MAEKGPDAFRTISEVAGELDVPQHVLRFWETRFSQVRPMKRGGGRRYYRPEDVALLKGIRTLLYGDGFTIKGVQRILREKGVQHVSAIGRGEGTTDTGAHAQVVEFKTPTDAETVEEGENGIGGSAEQVPDSDADTETDRTAETVAVKAAALRSTLDELDALKSMLDRARE